MAASFDLTEYLNRGAEQLIQDILRATLHNPKETAFLHKYGSLQNIKESRRLEHEAKGLHIPLFLIASITNACNLYCKGCYARANGQCGTQNAEPMLTANEWSDIFRQADDAGISYILLAGGEPFMRPDVLKEAAGHEGILFPIFTNGTMIDREMIVFLNRHRNLVPVISLEGGEATTDDRRGEGAYQRIQTVFDNLSGKKLLFGVSLTITTNNMSEAMSPEYMRALHQKGCRVVFLIEYVPVEHGTENLALGDVERAQMDRMLESLRASFPGMVFLSFPGDEKHMDGCLAAGRGFFHINAHGAAEPCPFSPYSDIGLRNHTLLQALESPFFQRVRELNLHGAAHAGGCALFEHEAQVQELLLSSKA